MMEEYTRPLTIEETGKVTLCLCLSLCGEPTWSSFFPEHRNTVCKKQSFLLKDVGGNVSEEQQQKNQINVDTNCQYSQRSCYKFCLWITILHILWASHFPRKVSLSTSHGDMRYRFLFCFQRLVSLELLGESAKHALRPTMVLCCTQF
ncbi:hypothetical protein Q5P01_010116 [Channa striata]|uniref:Uncharacterized protein n=1 Tax=Channa striata TaxID=64152 RepID=A0AA88MZ71_CHASR|nr:hypothetical protein Q5P01_010116 [Channa striata]